MGAAACELLDVELALDRVEAELRAELRTHVDAFARAYARGARSPAAPEVMHRAATVELARRAQIHGELACRGARLLREIAAAVIEAHPVVAAARAAPPTWASLRALARARETIARARFGRGALELVHRLAGVPASGSTGVGDAAPRTPAEVPPPIQGWTEPGPAHGEAAVAALWASLAARFEVRARGLQIVRSATARPRAFVVEPGAHVIAVVPQVIDTPATRFAVLHELGHAVLALGAGGPWPRVLDEAAASFVARFMEVPDALPPGWGSPLATEARVRRTQLARALDAIERRLLEDVEPALARPPWALWHDPGAQAAYARAEAVADELWTELGGARAPGFLGRELAARAVQVDCAVVV